MFETKTDCCSLLKMLICHPYLDRKGVFRRIVDCLIIIFVGYCKVGTEIERVVERHHTGTSSTLPNLVIYSSARGNIVKYYTEVQFGRVIKVGKVGVQVTDFQESTIVTKREKPLFTPDTRKSLRGFLEKNPSDARSE